MRCAIPTPSDIVQAARRYLGAPFAHQGRVPAGLDCAGLLVRVARDLGFDPIDDTTYDHNPSHVVLRRYLDMQPFLMTAPGRDRLIGDVALMSLSSRLMRGHHLAILTELGIIHAYAPARKVVETVLSESMADSIVRVYRWRS